MGNLTADSLIGYHCFTGCDSTSAFHGKGKIKPFELMCAASNIQNAVSEIGDSWKLASSFSQLEKFVCRIYNSQDSSVDRARYQLFCTNAFNEKRLPPTSDSLKLHILRANYQARIHKLAVVNITDPPCPSGHGWIIHQDTLSVRWMTLDPAPPELLRISKCSCQKTKCKTKQCSCFVAGVSCTPLCGCVVCENSDESVAESQLLNDESGSDLSDDDV